MLRIGKGWLIVVVAMTVIGTLGGLGVMAVMRTRDAAQRTADL